MWYGSRENDLNKLWAAEYNVGNNITYETDETGAWTKSYNIYDHLGSLRSKLKPDGTILAKKDYEPFGKELLGNHSRLGYIGKEKDAESSLADHGVRKYDSETGRFTAMEPLLDKYYFHTPYHYCRNNPISRVDDNGFSDYYSGYSGDFLSHVDDGTNKQFLQYESVAPLEIKLDDNVGLTARITFAEMRGGNDDAKQLVAESVVNRWNNKSSHSREFGPIGEGRTIASIIKNGYDAARSDEPNTAFNNPFGKIYKTDNKTGKEKLCIEELDAWHSSMSAAIKAVIFKSNKWNKVLFYNSSDKNWNLKQKNPESLKSVFIPSDMDGIVGAWTY